MTDHYRIIRKEINLTSEELEQIQKLMKQEHADQFSPFVRQKLMDLVEGRRSVADWFTLWQSQKIEQISRDILQVTIMAEQTQQVTAEHLRIILTCVQELMAEVEKAIPLSPDFRDKYMGGIDMENRYRTNLKKVFLTDQELATLHDRIGQSGCKNFSAYARKVLLNPTMTFLTIDTSNYEELVFELKRIGNNLNQIARTVNQNHILTPNDRELLVQGISQLITEVEKDFNIKCQQLKEFYGRH